MMSVGEESCNRKSLVTTYKEGNMQESGGNLVLNSKVNSKRISSRI